MKIKKRISLIFLIVGLIAAIAGGSMLTVRSIKRAQYTPTTSVDSVQPGVKIDVEELPDDLSSDGESASDVSGGEADA